MDRLAWGLASVLAATLTLAGCSDPPTVPAPPSYEVHPEDQWAGGTVEISASGGSFQVGDVIVRDLDTLTVLDRAADRVAVRLPSDANGPTKLEVRRDGRVLGEVATEAYGFEQLKEYPARMDDFISEVPVPRGVSVVARRYEHGCCGDSEGGFVWIYPSTGMHRTFPGTPDLWNLFRVGVDPLTGDVYYERWWGEEGECLEVNCNMVRRARIAGGELVDLGWIERPCNRYSCQPLAGDIWIALDGGNTCRVHSHAAGDTCEYIDGSFNADDPHGIEYLWSGDVAVLVGPSVAIQISTGRHAWQLSDWYNSAAVDEARGLFYLSARDLEWLEESRQMEIVTVRGDTGEEESAFEFTAWCPEDATPPASCGQPEIGYDPARDLLYLLRGDTRTVQARDPVTFELRGEVVLPDEIGFWNFGRVLVDDFTQRIYVVMSGAYWYDEALGDTRPVEGTPVISVRLPPVQ